MAKTCITVALATATARGSRYTVATLTTDGSAVLADSGMVVPVDWTTCRWLTVAALTSAMRADGERRDPNVGRLDTLPLSVDFETGTATLVDANGERRGLPHAAGIGIVTLLDRHPNARDLEADAKARILASVTR